jgi:hypothetical protein
VAHNGWIGVDLDGTLAYYDGWKGETHIGDPIPLMVARVKNWLVENKDVRVFTARAHVEDFNNSEGRKAIENWCLENIGCILPITNVKDFAMVQLWDDRAIQIKENTGVRVDGKI